MIPRQLELIWRAPDGYVMRKFLPWRHAATSARLEEYLWDYFDLLDNGYRPKNFSYVPIPHCARIHQGSSVLAEWHSSLGRSSESLVTGRTNQAGEASPQHDPSPATTTSQIEDAPEPQCRDNSQGSAAKATQVESGSGIPAA